MDKVIFITHGKANPYEESGMSRVVYYRAKYLREFYPEIETTIFSFFDDASGETSYYRDSLEIKLFPRFHKHPFNNPLIRKVLSEYKNSTVADFHLMWLYDKVPVAKALQGRSLPYVVSAHGAYTKDRIKIKWWKKFPAKLLYELSFLNCSKGVIAQTPEELTELREFGVTVPIYISSIALDKSEIELANKIEPAKLQGKIKFGWVGNISPVKNLDNLLIAISHLPNSLKKDIKLYVIGPVRDQRYFKKLKSIIKEHGLDGIVEFLGPLFREDKFSVLKGLDCYIHVSTSETISLAVLEAMACGRPMIISRTAQVSYLYNRGFFIMVEPWAEHISVGLRQFLELSLVERSIMGKKALDVLQNEFTWDRKIHEYVAILKHVAG